LGAPLRALPLARHGKTVYTAAFNSHNCIRFATAMIVPQLGTGAEGWKGDLHGRKRDG
jgi:hypothetical protein